jgi:hypothetical protein
MGPARETDRREEIEANTTLETGTIRGQRKTRDQGLDSLDSRLVLR